ncbi:dihydropteroate synthase [Thalassoroseus pseudoceratinae]|uniref:dihydropteroate synthase n=1 Tax=Thalassoroseus pseudoceratinae TaxID=2713176 RepID=UPI001F0F94D0|nr:dihydropteroate synthase [Thalassoroseus pseudoceratinae]
MSPLKPETRYPWRVGDKSFDWTELPTLMGIVNVTPDSFSDGGSWLDVDRAVEHALSLVEQGAGILDIGGESTRPGADPVSFDEELRRVLPVVEELSSRTDVPISIDTTKAEVARQTLAAGASIVNDISGLTFDPDMPGVCAEENAGVVCMHIQGTPQTMQNEPHYEDVLREVLEFLEHRMEVLESAGIPRERIVLDPGIGFGKTATHNLELLSNIAALRSTQRPVLIGHSRKRFLKAILGRPVEERSSGTIGVSIALADQGADILRVHDVAAVRDALTAWHTLKTPPTNKR